MTKPQFYYWTGDEMPRKKYSIEIPDELWNSFIESDYCTECEENCSNYVKISEKECTYFHTFLYETYDAYRKEIISEEVGNFLLIRAEHDSDLIQFILNLVKKKGIEMAAFTVIGALKRAKLEFYDQEKHKYQETSINHPNEIASCVGNVSLKNGTPFVHAHAVLADENGDTKAGHLAEGIVFAAEIHLQELKGTTLQRKHDPVTDLTLWEIK